MSNGILNKIKYLAGLEDFEEEIEEVEEEVEELEVPVTRGMVKNNKIVNIHTHTNSTIKLAIYEPKKYDEVTRIVEDLKVKKLVVLNLESTHIEIKKQVFDFVNGAIYALEGNIQKVTKDIFIVAPSNVEIDSNLKEELKSKGIFPWQKL
ncbi:cell division protein SepF [Gottschalkia acidurici 9a]|uniref:Cell division protein SepF n=1 Tax=Gottschalkia acidurici (strain ATCC 7906 / DSM 604 / BCRC 14475 / CIP 104303 / KCTC 5404 / NCIMB 10678 / 9a) TaxID=1128398 RepID=K0AY44_GOTA9|nr:cell division protein SepF [Gottschalkia acidurici]AFS78708.1 cell division protein SepF [Gottschalkia acidurici 9a]